MVIAKGRGIKEFSEIISIEQQITELSFTPKENMIKNVHIQAFNALTGDPLPNVMLRLRKCTSKISSEGLTKEKGEFSYIIDANCTHYLDVERKGFIPYSFEFYQTKGNEEDNLIKVPLFPIEKLKTKVISNPDKPEEDIEIKPGLFRAVLLTDNEDSNSTISFELNACIINPENNEEQEVTINSSQPKFKHDSLVSTFTSLGDFGSSITVSATCTESQAKWFRLTARIGSSTLTSPSGFSLDHNFKNTLQDHNCKVMLFDEKKLVSICYIPSFISDMTLWDIGFINPSAKKFIKINA